MRRPGILRRIFNRPNNETVSRPDANAHYSLAHVREQLEHFGIEKPALLVDELTDYEALALLPRAEDADMFSFALSEIGREAGAGFVRALDAKSPPRAADGWLNCAGNKFSGYSLNQFLLNNDLHDRPIIRYVRPAENTDYYSYVDFFAGETRTIVHINNYLDHCYRIPFPLDLRFTLRSSDGSVTRTGQFIIPPNGIQVITGESIGVRDFTGYLEIEFNLAGRVSPFLHYMVDYETADFISSNHQSGLGLHPAQSAFTRGYVPVSDEETMEVCLFQRNYSEPVVAAARLSYTRDGIRETAERELPPLHRNQLLFQDVKELFPGVDFAKAGAPTVEVRAPVPLHRPNYYYLKSGSRAFYDTSHAGPDPKVYRESLGGESFSADEIAALKTHDCQPARLAQFIPPADFGLEALLGLGNDATRPIKNFVLDFHDVEGDLRFSHQRELDSDRQTYFDFPEIRERPELADFHGTVVLRAAEDKDPVPLLWNAVSAYRRPGRSAVTSTAAGGSMADNTPFYFRGAPPNYIGDNCAVGVTDIFARGMADAAFDTFFAIMYSTAHPESRAAADLEIQVINSAGRRAVTHRTIQPNGCLYIKLSDLLQETRIQAPDGYFTVWFLASGAHLYGQHFLHRLRDGAMSVEHCYVGRFGL